MFGGARAKPDPNAEIDGKIADVRARIARTLASYRRQSGALRQQIDLWGRKYEARRTGSYRVLDRISRACDFAEKCHAAAGQLRSPAFICRDVESLLAAHGSRSEGAIIVLDVVEPPAYRLRWSRADQPIDPFVHALDRAVEGLLSLSDVALTASCALGEELQRAGVRTIIVPDYPTPRPFERATGIREACGLGPQDRLALLFDRVEEGFSARTIVGALDHLSDHYHMAVIGDRGDAAGERYKRELDEYLATTRLGGRVHLCPPVAGERLPTFAGSADLGVIGLDPADPGQRMQLPGSLFDCIAARLPVAAGDLPDVQRLLRLYQVGGQFDRRTPGAIAECLAALAPEKGRLASALDRAANELVWSRNEAALLALFRGLGSVTMLRAEPTGDQSRTNRIASTLLNHGIAVTVVNPQPAAEGSVGPGGADTVPGARYVDIPIDM